ncbi:MAG: O-antigen ligase domain-containing protein [Sphingobacteriales bacterium]|nr:MAG: O-antigen ligase domain-containing protein [Sphingobacteriales bacterium]
MITFSALKRNLPIIIVLLLLGGLLFSRALLSMAEGVAALYGIISLLENGNKFSSFVVWSFVPLVLFGLGIYQTGIHTSIDLDYLLTLTAYPALILFNASLDSGQRKQLGIIWVVTVFVSLLYPLGWYVSHINEAFHRYKEGQSLPTFMSNDHIRYGIFVCSGLIPLLYEKFFEKKIQNILIIILSLVIVFLSVRSAWVALLILMIIYAIGNLKWQQLLGGFLLLLIFAFASYKLIPTVEQKVNYTIYDWKAYPADKYSPDFSDGARRSINNAAWKTINEKHRTNVGWNNVPAVLQQEFQLQYPGTVIKYGWPFNQFLFWWMGAGLIGLILFSLWLLYPVLIFFKEKNKALLSWTLIIALTCLVESTINMQYGVFLHAWVIGFAAGRKNKAE